MSHPIRSLACIVGFAAALATASNARAQSCPLVVDPTGAAGSHFTDIQPAVNHFKANLGNGSQGSCTIVVRPGEYRNSVSIDGVNTAATGENRLVIRGTRGEAQEWLSRFNTGSRDAVKFKSSRFVSVEDFEVLGGTNKPFAIEGGSASNDGITLARNNVHDNGGGRDSGCVFVGDNNQRTWIVNNVCWANHADNIVVGRGGSGNAVVNNTILLSDKSGISVAKTANVVIANNLVLFNATAVGAGINLSVSGGGTAGARRVLHNIVYGNGSSGDITNAASSNVTSQNNLTTAMLGAGLLVTDFLEEPAAGNFHLAADSPALNAGIASTGTPNRVPSDDFEGDPRSDAAPDVGVDEVSDADHDGVPDLGDNCPPGLNSSYNPEQGDSDGDGVGNYCDNCPDVPNPSQADVSGFDAFGNSFAGPNGRGDACEGIGQSLFQVPTGPAADATFVATFGALGDVNTVVPDCQTTYFYCQDTSGRQVPRNDQVVSRGIPDSLADPPYTAGDQVTVACALGELFVAEAFSDGSFSCKACYSNEHQDLNLREDGTCADPDGDPCVENFTGIVCSAPQTIAFDSTAGRNGCSPGYWRNHLERWSEAGLAPSADFDATFGVTLFEPNITLGQAVELGGGYPNDLARHGTAALVSASHPDVNYPFEPDAVKALVKQGEVDPLAAANNLGCPLN